jgi:hypothetical protein
VTRTYPPAVASAALSILGLLSRVRLFRGVQAAEGTLRRRVTTCCSTMSPARFVVDLVDGDATERSYLVISRAT